MESKPVLSERIHQRRTQKDYSQEDAEVSIRTFQKIEAGQTEAQGYTLIALADTPDVATEELMDFTKKHDRSTLCLIRLSTLVCFVLP